MFNYITNYLDSFDPIYREASARFNKSCGDTAKIASISKAVFFSLAALGVAVFTLGAPVLGAIAVLSGGTLACISYDIEKISDFAMGKIKADFIDFGFISFHLSGNNFEKLDANTLLRLSSKMRSIFKDASAIASPISRPFLNIADETSSAVLKIRRGLIDQSFMSKLFSNAADTREVIPNLDLIREGIQEGGKALGHFSEVSGAFFGAIAFIGALSLVTGSSLPALALTSVLAVKAYKENTVNRVAMIALAIVSAAFLVLGLTSGASISLLITGLGCLTLSYDLKQFSKNVIEASNEESLKNFTAIFSGWGVAGLYKTTYAHLPDWLRSYSDLAPVIKAELEISEEANRKITVWMDKNLKAGLGRFSNKLKDQLTKGMSPLGKYLVEQAYQNKLKNSFQK